MTHKLKETLQLVSGVNATILSADDSPKKIPTFEMVAYTGQEVVKYGIRFIVDVAGIKFNRSEIPIRKEHSALMGVGHADKIWVDDNKLMASGVISRDTEDAREVVASAKKSFPWQASIGIQHTRVEEIRAGAVVTVNGNTFAGPGYVIRESKLGEISFVDAGADDATSASIAASLDSTQSGNLENIMENENDTGATTVPAATPAAPAAQPATQLNQDAGAAPAAPPKPMATSFDQLAAEGQAENHRRNSILQMSQDAVNENPAMAVEITKLGQQATEAGTSVTDFKFQLMAQSQTYPGIGGPRSDRRESSSVLEAGLCITGGMSDAELASEFSETELNQADDRFKGSLMLHDIVDKFARQNGFTGHSVLSDPDAAIQFAAMSGSMQLAAASTISVQGILSNVANKFLARGFDSVESVMDMISSTRNAKDFKRITSYSLTGDFTYKKVAANGELEHAKADEVSYGNQVGTRGIQFALTREHLINDDLGVFTSMQRKHGRGGRLTLNEVFWATYLAGRSSGFWHVDNNNVIVGAASALGMDSMTAAKTKYAKQTDTNGKPLGSTPAILLVPSALEAQADQILKSTEVRGTGSNFGTANVHAGTLKRVSSAYLGNTAIHDNASDTGWDLLASPADLPTIEVAYLKGRKRPTVESAKMPIGFLGIQFMAYFDFGVELQEHRGSVHSNGTD